MNVSNSGLGTQNRLKPCDQGVAGSESLAALVEGQESLLIHVEGGGIAPTRDAEGNVEP